jgi:hypothetical protein
MLRLAILVHIFKGIYIFASDRAIVVWLGHLCPKAATILTVARWCKDRPMPARDRYHEQVKRALIQDGWTITHDPLRLQWGLRDMYVDLGAEQLLAAEKGSGKIAVEVKSFVGLSEMDDLEKAVGQFVVYHDVLSNIEPDRVLYLAVAEEIYVDLFEEPIGKLLIANGRVRVLVFDPYQEVIRQWIPTAPIAP